MRDALDCETNSPHEHLRKYTENSKEKMNTDAYVIVERVKLQF